MCVSAYVRVKHTYCGKSNYEKILVCKNGNLGGRRTSVLTIPCVFPTECCRESVLSTPCVDVASLSLQSRSDLG